MFGVELTTPTVMRLLETASVLAVLVFLVVTTIAFANARNTFAVAGERTAAGAREALSLERHLSDMDATLANTLVVADRDDLDLAKKEVLDQYRNGTPEAFSSIVGATRSLEDGAEAQSSELVTEIITKLPEYQGHADKAVLLQSLDRDDDARVEYRYATNVMQTALLPAARRLGDERVRRLEIAYEQQREQISTVADLVTAVVVVCFATLLVSQLFLFRRTRRVVNLGLAGATLLLVTGAGLAGLGLSNASADLKVAKTDAFDSATALRRAEGALHELRADQSRWMFDRENATVVERHFIVQSERLLRVKDGGSTITSYWGVTKTVADKPELLSTDRRYEGHLTEAYRGTDFSSEGEDLRNVLSRYERYHATLGKLRDTFPNDAEVIREVVGSQAIGDLDSAIEEALRTNDQAFTEAIQRGSTSSTVWLILLPMLSAGCIALIIAGFRPRIADYQRVALPGQELGNGSSGRFGGARRPSSVTAVRASRRSRPT